VLEILDSFGQRSVLTFRQMKLNPALAATAFAFKTPRRGRFDQAVSLAGQCGVWFLFRRLQFGALTQTGGPR